ncbi:DUF7159 family protein [Mycobacterium servetii]|uniref:DUF7159 domain-containing protein n=1 Tax=Mycobacterium servetii TaxID=3237418 RepID=A0ABV4C733_9MYCO
MVDIVLGVSMTPTRVRMVLVEGENADGVVVDQDDFDTGQSSPADAPSQVVSAILGTRQGAEEGGYQLLSTGVTWTDHVEAAMLRDALIDHKLENVMLVSAFMAAAALAQSVGDATNCTHTALLFVEPYTATLAVINTADGSVSDVHRRVLSDDDQEAVAELAGMVSGAEALDARPEGVVVVGSGVDVPLIKPALEAATSLRLAIPDEPETALARGAALASANAPLFASSTAALAYALDPGTGEIDPLALAGQSPGLLPAYQGASDTAGDGGEGEDNVAYSAVPDEDADAQTVVFGPRTKTPRRKSLMLVGSTLTVIVIAAVVALEIALAINIRPTVALRPSPNENIIVPTHSAPAPAVQAKPPRPVVIPHPIRPPAVAPAPAAPPAPAPIPVVPPPVPVPVPRVPIIRPPVPRAPVVHPPAPRWGGRGPFGVPGPRGPFGGGPFGGPGPRGPFGGGPFGGGRGPLGGLFGGGHGGFGGGHGFGGHGFGGFGGGHGFGGFGGGFGRR